MSEASGNVNPLSQLDGEVRQAFIDAGWVPGRSRLTQSMNGKRTLANWIRAHLSSNYRNVEKKASENILTVLDRDYDLFPAAVHVVSELVGIRVKPLAAKGSCQPYGLIFRDTSEWGLRSEIQLVSRIIRARLVPIAEIQSLAVVLLSDTGHVLTLGAVAPGVYLEGNSFSEAVERILTGKCARRMIFAGSLDPNHVFANVDTPDDKERMQSLLLDRASTLLDLDTAMPFE